MSDTATPIIRPNTTGEVPDPTGGTLNYSTGTPRTRNRERGLRAGLGVKAYAEHIGNLDEMPEVTISDLLSDLHHLCDALSLDLDVLLSRGHDHYIAEISGDD